MSLVLAASFAAGERLDLFFPNSTSLVDNDVLTRLTSVVPAEPDRALEVRISVTNAVVLSPATGGSGSINATFIASVGASVLSGSLVRIP